MTPSLQGLDDIPLERVNILIVDDLPEKHLVYKTILEELNQNLVFAHSGAEALKLVLQQEFAVILLDVNMPEMDGFEAASFIRSRKRSAKTPIIFLTAFMDEMHVAQGYASGAVDYLPTPVMPEVLKAKVRVFIELSQMRQYAAYQAEERVKHKAAEEIAKRAEFLVKVSEVLGRAQNKKEVMDSLLLLPVPDFADLTISWVFDEQGKPDQINWFWKGMKEEQAQPLPSEHFFKALPWLQKIIEEPSHSPQVRLLGKLPPSSREAVPGIPDLSSAIVLPLIIRQKAVGCLVIAREKSGVNYQDNDVSWGRTLASRAVIALENAMLIEKIREADQRKDEFLAMLAHELRNPLAPISNALQVMDMFEFPNSRMGELAKIMRRQVQHMNRLVDDLLDVSRITQGRIELKRETVELAEIVQSAIETSRSLLEQAAHTLTVHLPEEPIYLTGDNTRLSQVFSNLLNNSAKYTPRGGKISLTAVLDGAEIVISVRDNGAGIPQHMLPKIFEMFIQVDSSIERSQGGLGIGLKLVKELCELHGGTVTAFSEGLGKGCEFTVRLPLAEKCAVIPIYAEKKASVEKAFRVLVVDDNHASAQTMVWTLEMLGHKAEAAHDGLSGMELARAFRPDIVLLDIGLPGMNGYDVCRRMREDALFRNTLFIAQTGWGHAEHRQRSREAGFSQHLVKPVDMQVLQKVLNDHHVFSQERNASIFDLDEIDS